MKLSSLVLGCKRYIRQGNLPSTLIHSQNSQLDASTWTISTMLGGHQCVRVYGQSWWTSPLDIRRVLKTKNPFSAVAIDQAHEQNTSHVNDDGRVIGLIGRFALKELLQIIFMLVHSLPSTQDMKIRVSHHYFLKMGMEAKNKMLMSLCGYAFKEGWQRFLIHDVDPDVIITVSSIPGHYLCIWTLGSIW